MELNGFYKAEMLTANLEKNTITFKIEGDFKIKSGKYFIFSEKAMREFKNLICEKQKEICLRFFNECQDFIGIDNSALEDIKQPKIEDLL